MDGLIIDTKERGIVYLQLVPFKNKEYFFGLQQARAIIQNIFQVIN